MRLPPSAVTMSFGRASSMRAARLAAANPPNTTEWIAPIPAHCQVPVDRVVAEVGFSSDEPSGERRPAVVEHFLGRLLPVHELRLLRPETFLVFDGSPMEFAVSRHRAHPSSSGATFYGS